MGDSYRGGRGGRGGGYGDRGGYSGGGERGEFSGGRGRGYPGRGAPRGGGRGGFSGGPDLSAPMPEMAHHPILVSQQMPQGREGTPVELVANFYRLNTEDIGVYHYDLGFKRQFPNDSGSSGSKSSSPSGSTDSDDSRTERFIKKFAPTVARRFIELNQHTIFQGVRHVYDGYKNLYTTRELNMDGHSSIKQPVTIQVDGRPVDFTIRMKLVERVPLNEVIDYYQRKKPSLSDRAVSIYETLFRFILGNHFEVFQRKFMDMEQVQSSPKTQLAEFVQGFTSAVRMTEIGLALNVHLKTSCIISRQIQSMVELARIVAGIRPDAKPSQNQLMDMTRFVKHLKVCTRHGSRENVYMMDSVVNKCARDMNFTNKDGVTLSVADYFQQEYGIQCQMLPLIKTTGRSARYLPMELCYLVPNQFLSNAKINAQIQREMLLKSTHTPNVYFNKLQTVVRKVASLDTDLQREFGVNLDTRPVCFKGRVLPTPRQLNADNRSKFYEVTPPPARWAVFCFDPDITEQQLRNFVNQLMDRARFFGLNLGQPSPVASVTPTDSENLYNVFYNLQKRCQAEFVFVGIPTRHPTMQPAHIYGLTKYYCDQKFGLISQCFKTEYIERTPGGYFDNFLLKVNGKIGGRNAVLDPAMLQQFPWNMQRTMFVGIDVNHPAEAERVASSVAVTVGSVDSMFSKYTASIRVQKKETDDILRCVDWMMFELFKEYYKVNGVYPENVIIFRDGVPEGLFQKIITVELPLVQKAINHTGQPMKMVVIVTQKHHNTRFALTQVNTQTRKPTWNVPSGTVVDNTIVQPQYKMFYLNSHFSPLGTSRPTKYVILRDDLNMTPDVIQKLAFVTCFNSVRTRGVIAIPTPVRYADLCAYRAKVHIDSQRELIERSSITGKVEDIEIEIVARLNDLVKVNDDIKNRLYYC